MQAYDVVIIGAGHNGLTCAAYLGMAGTGYQIMGPYPCDKSWFKYCKSAVANSNTGSTIYVGAPIGAVAGLAAQLNGKAPPPLNECGSE